MNGTLTARLYTLTLLHLYTSSSVETCTFSVVQKLLQEAENEHLLLSTQRRKMKTFEESHKAEKAMSSRGK